MDLTRVFKVTLYVEPREDGGLRVWSDDVPELVLSHRDPQRVMSDILPALRAILEARLGGSVNVVEIQQLPLTSDGIQGSGMQAIPGVLRKLELAALAA